MKKQKLASFSLLTVLGVSMIGSQSVYAVKVAETKSIGSVNFVESSKLDPTPVDPTDPTKPIEPGGNGEGQGTSGTLRFDRVPNLKFASIPVSNEVETVGVLEEKYTLVDDPGGGLSKEFYAAPTVEISDVRGSNSGWHAKVNLENELFVDKLDNTSKIKATITFKTGRVAGYSNQDSSIEQPAAESITLSTVAYTFVNADTGAGAYQWGISYFTGDQGNGEKPKKNYTNTPNEDEAINMSFAPGTKVNIGAGHVYENTLVWSLFDTPDN